MAEAADLRAGMSDILRELASRVEPRGPRALRGLREIQVGVLHSQTGFLRELEAGVLRATLLAFQEINDHGGLLGRRVVPIVADGRSSETVFMEQAAHLIGREDMVTLFGCSTSSSRRRVKPLIEDNEQLLFYPFQYEGIEASPHIAYVGPTPNQQALPAVDWLFGQGRRNFLLIGSDYVYPVVTNELIKDRIASLGGRVTGEQYFGMGCRDFREAVDAVAQQAPDAVILTIVGLASNYAFLQQLHRARCRVPTVLSLVLSEDDLANIAIEYTAGIYTLFSYFQNIDHPLNQDFVRRYKQRFGDRSRIGGYMESAYVGVYLWAKAVQKADSVERGAIKLAMKGISHFGPGGMAYMDEENNHVWRHVRVAQVGRDGEYHVAWNSEQPVRPEPYPPCKSVEEWHAYLRLLRERWRGHWGAISAAPADLV
jgi:urea transport system substrate-binding protein